MHNRSDQFAKNLLRDGLSLVSAAEIGRCWYTSGSQPTSRRPTRRTT
ncbi:hypothetical protein AB3662_43745 [Sorangium cellulosum]